MAYTDALSAQNGPRPRPARGRARAPGSALLRSTRPRALARSARTCDAEVCTVMASNGAGFVGTDVRPAVGHARRAASCSRTAWPAPKWSEAACFPKGESTQRAHTAPRRTCSRMTATRRCGGRQEDPGVTVIRWGRPGGPGTPSAARGRGHDAHVPGRVRRPRGVRSAPAAAVPLHARRQGHGDGGDERTWTSSTAAPATRSCANGRGSPQAKHPRQSTSWEGPAATAGDDTAAPPRSGGRSTSRRRVDPWRWRVPSDLSLAPIAFLSASIAPPLLGLRVAHQGASRRHGTICVPRATVPAPGAARTRPRAHARRDARCARARRRGAATRPA